MNSQGGAQLIREVKETLQFMINSDWNNSVHFIYALVYLFSYSTNIICVDKYCLQFLQSCIDKVLIKKWSLSAWPLGEKVWCCGVPKISMTLPCQRIDVTEEAFWWTMSTYKMNKRITFLIFFKLKLIKINSMLCFCLSNLSGVLQNWELKRFVLSILKCPSFLSQYCKQYGTKNKLTKMIQAIEFPLCFSWLFICFFVQILRNKSKLENLIMYINVLQKKLMMETLLIHFT